MILQPAAPHVDKGISFHPLACLQGIFQKISRYDAQCEVVDGHVRREIHLHTKRDSGPLRPGGIFLQKPVYRLIPAEHLPLGDVQLLLEASQILHLLLPPHVEECMDMMPEIVFDDPDLFDMLQRLVIVFPLPCDDLTRERQLVLGTFPVHGFQDAVDDHHIQDKHHPAQRQKKQNVFNPAQVQRLGGEYRISPGKKDREKHGRISGQQRAAPCGKPGKKNAYPSSQPEPDYAEKSAGGKYGRAYAYLPVGQSHALL